MIRESNDLDQGYQPMTEDAASKERVDAFQHSVVC